MNELQVGRKIADALVNLFAQLVVDRLNNNRRPEDGFYSFVPDGCNRFEILLSAPGLGTTLKSQVLVIIALPIHPVQRRVIGVFVDPSANTFLTINEVDRYKLIVREALKQFFLHFNFTEVRFGDELIGP